MSNKLERTYGSTLRAQRRMRTLSRRVLLMSGLVQVTLWGLGLTAGASAWVGMLIGVFGFLVVLFSRLGR